MRAPELSRVGSRVRRRLNLDYALRGEPLACIDHFLAERRGSCLRGVTGERGLEAAHGATLRARTLGTRGDELVCLTRVEEGGP